MAVPTAEMEALGREMGSDGPGEGREDAWIARAMVMARERPERTDDSYRTLWMEEGAVFVRDPRAREDTPAADALRRFATDRTFPSSSLESVVANDVALAAADEALRGFNASLVAYGAAGTGKTWTLFGGGVPTRHVSEDDYVAFGVLGHIFHRVFERVAAAEAQGEGEGGGRRYEVGLAMWEVLDDQVLDLFAREPRVRGTAATSLKFATTRCRSVREALALLRAGQRRSSGFSADRAPSAVPNSGHTFVRVVLHDAARGGRVSTLHVVDLAGNRSVAQRASPLSPSRRRAISQDHVALNRIVNALASLASRRRHGGDEAAWQRPPASEVLAAVPGRATALARIMGPLLAGNSRALLLACVDPAARCHAETVDTLGFAERVRDVDNVCARLEGVPRAALALRELDTVLGVDDVLFLTTGGEAPLPDWPQQEEAGGGEGGKPSDAASSSPARPAEDGGGGDASGEVEGEESGGPSPSEHGSPRRASPDGSGGEGLEHGRGGDEASPRRSQLHGRGGAAGCGDSGDGEEPGEPDGAASVEAATRRLGGAKSRYASALADVEREIQQRTAAITSRRGWEREDAAGDGRGDTTAGYASHVLYPHGDHGEDGGAWEEEEEQASLGRGAAGEDSELFNAATGQPVTGDESLFLVGGGGTAAAAAGSPTAGAGGGQGSGSGEGRRVTKLRHEIRAMMNELLPEAGEEGAEQGTGSSAAAEAPGPELGLNRTMESDEERSFAGAYEMADDTPPPMQQEEDAYPGEEAEVHGATEAGGQREAATPGPAPAPAHGSGEVLGQGGAPVEEEEAAAYREIGGASAIPLPPRPEPYPSRGPLRGAASHSGAPASGPPRVGGAGQSQAGGGAADSVERQLARLQKQLGGGGASLQAGYGQREGGQDLRFSGRSDGPVTSLERAPAQAVLLSMLREETRLKELQARRVEEVRSEMGEEVAQLTLHLHDRDLELVDLRARVRKLQAGTDFADVFARYDRDFARLQEELNAARARVAALETARAEEVDVEVKEAPSEAESAVAGGGGEGEGKRDHGPLLTPAKVHTIQFLPDERRKRLALSFSAREGDREAEAASRARQQVSASTGSHRGRAGRSREAAVLGPWRKRVRTLERELAAAQKEVVALRDETRCVRWRRGALSPCLRALTRAPRPPRSAPLRCTSALRRPPPASSTTPPAPSRACGSSWRWSACSTRRRWRRGSARRRPPRRLWRGWRTWRLTGLRRARRWPICAPPWPKSPASASATSCTRAWCRSGRARAP